MTDSPAMVPAERPEQLVAKVLKRLYPQNPDIVLGREARNIVAALSDAGYVIVLRPIGPDGTDAS